MTVGANAIPDESPAPTFEDLGLHPGLLKGVADLGFKRPTPIQAQAIPHILAGRDVIGSAQTGTGKTAAFVLPLVHRLLTAGRKGIKGLVVAPTRELAQQSADHLAELSKYVPVKGCAVYGGVPFPPQVRALASHPDVVSATPGRLLDHVRGGRIDLRGVEIFVLDEADRMMDMGFLPDVRRILSLLPASRQNLVFSATLPPATLRVAEDICRDPVHVRVGGIAPKVPVGIRHAVYPVEHEQKEALLLRLIQDLKEGSVLVFMRTKDRADRVAAFLQKSGVAATVMHGDRSQAERQAALDSFRSGRHRVLVATDLAARGLDIDDITHVINFDLPEEPETYIHRIGRTGRAEAEGDAFSLMAPMEEPWITAVEKVLGGNRLPRVILPDFPYRKSNVAGSWHPRPFYIPGPYARKNRAGRGRPGGGRGGGFRRR
jgi:ATP-dependent RNA helicase RhlE